jgi:hypothetical protein
MGRYSLFYSAVRGQALSDDLVLHADVARRTIFFVKYRLGVDF